MRASEKGMNIQSADAKAFGADFHDIIQKEQEAGFEQASEFGFTAADVKKFKKRMERS